MNKSVFTPNISQVEQESAVRPQAQPQPQPVKSTKSGGPLLRTAQFAVIALVGLLPIFFVPGLWASLGFDKVLLSLVLGFVVVVAMSLLALRKRSVTTAVPTSLLLFYGFVFVALISSLLSNDVQDAIRGSFFETQTVGFLLIMALVMSVTLVMQGSKKMSMLALVVFGASSLGLLLYNVIRIAFGPGFLPFGSFGAATISPIGGFNDLAIYAGLLVVLGLITLLQLPMRAMMQYAVAGLIGFSLLVLAVVNFFDIWLVIGFFGLLLFVFLLSRDTLFSSDDEEKVTTYSALPMAMTALVCIFSAVFIIVGDYAGEKISNVTGINYVEVRPSAQATLDIASASYKENVLLGVGPNRFADAWRQYKNPGINETIFWDTDFVAGSGYVPTLMVDMGVLGGLLLVLSHIFLLLAGYNMLLRTRGTDPFWYYFGMVSFAGAVFLWGMSYIYVPGAGILLLAALFTGFTFVSFGSTMGKAVRTIPLAVSRQRGFALMAAVIIVVTGATGVLFSVGKQYVAQTNFSVAQATADSIESFEADVAAAYELYPDDRFLGALAQLQLLTMSQLVNIPEPTEENQQAFLTAAEQGLLLAERAVAEDPTNPDNYAVLAGIYSNLAVAGVEGAQARATESLNAAQSLDPLNPGYKLIAAQIAIRAGDVEAARQEINNALSLKRNYTEALYLSAQLDIAEGNTEAAIATTRAIITLEPNNPTRYFQLGLLQSAQGSTTAAIGSFQAAISVDPGYANARYVLALAYLEEGDEAAALAELRAVLVNNSDNQELIALIEQIESGNYTTAPDLGLDAPVTDTVPGEGFDSTVTTDGTTDTELVTPVNTVPASEPSNNTEAQTAQ